MTRPRIVYVTDHVLGSHAGYGMRVGNTLAGLRAVGDVTPVFLARNVDDNTWPNDEAVTIAATEYRLRHGYPRSIVTGRPRDSMFANRDDVVRQLQTVIDASVDLVWVYRSRPVDAVGPAIAGHRPGGTRLVVDLDDLYDLHYAMLNDPQLTPSPIRRVGYRLDQTLWSRRHRQVIDLADLALVTSDEDRDHVGHEKSAVLANGYPHPAVNTVSPPNDGRCRMLFVGGYHYPPNADAARQLAIDVLPRVRKHLPDAELMLVGRPTGEVEELGRLDGVRYEGFPETLDAAFAEASVVVTPIRAGAGSRLKAIEAMARRKPLVSTAFGVQGFDVRAEQELLVADDADEQAAAVIRLHESPELADRLVANAYNVYRSDYSADAVIARTAELAEQSLAAKQAYRR